MSTPRHECPNCHSEAPAMQRIVRNSVCTDAFHYPKPEGVAAPLEPSQLTAEDFHNSREWVEHQPQSDRECLTEDGYWLAFAEMFAAAVSKNLEQKLADADQAACTWIADAEFWRKAYEGKLVKFQELEKEIAALGRDTGEKP